MNRWEYKWPQAIWSFVECSRGSGLDFLCHPRMPKVKGKPNHQYCSDFSTPASDSLFPMEMVQTLAWHTSLLSGSSLLFYPVSLRPFPSISAPLVSADKSNLHRIWLSLSSLTLCLSLQNKIFLFIWLCWVLVVTCRIFFQLQHVGSNFLTRNQTQAPCIGNAES